MEISLSNNVKEWGWFNTQQNFCSQLQDYLFKDHFNDKIGFYYYDQLQVLLILLLLTV